MKNWIVNVLIAITFLYLTGIAGLKDFPFILVAALFILLLAFLIRRIEIFFWKKEVRQDD